MSPVIYRSNLTFKIKPNKTLRINLSIVFTPLILKITVNRIPWIGAFEPFAGHYRQVQQVYIAVLADIAAKKNRTRSSCINCHRFIA